MVKNQMIRKVLIAILAWTGALLSPQWAAAHCDSLDGPVVNDARIALEKGEVTPALKWVMEEQEETVRAAFDQTMKVRKLEAEARNLADHYFFETLVRLHRQGEGAPYTGLQPAGMIEGPVLDADQALNEGSVEHLAEDISKHVNEAVRERFALALAARERAGESVAAGREFVEVYVEYIHFVEGVAGMVQGSHGH